MMVNMMTVQTIMTIWMTKIVTSVLMNLPDNYELNHDLHGSDGCEEYCVSHGAVNTDVSSLDENMRLEILSGDVALPRTRSDELSAVLQSSVVGAVGSGVQWCPTGGGGGGRGGGGCGDRKGNTCSHRFGMSGDCSRDVGGGVDVHGRP